jgi:hypothetical protein
MTRSEKLISRFLTRPKDFTYDELKRLLKGLGYTELQGSGSRVVFSNKKLNHTIKLHKPHPGKIIKKYQIDLVINELESKEIL